MAQTVLITPLQAVEAIYTAFGQGNVPAILDLLSPDVEWEAWSDNLAQRAGVPWLLPRRGHAGVAAFFELVGTWRIREFSVLSMMTGGNQVAVEFVLEAELPNGRQFRDEEMHLWTFGPDGRVVRLRHYADTAKHLRAAALMS